MEPSDARRHPPARVRAHAARDVDARRVPLRATSGRDFPFSSVTPRDGVAVASTSTSIHAGRQPSSFSSQADSAGSVPVAALTKRRPRGCPATPGC